MSLSEGSVLCKHSGHPPPKLIKKLSALTVILFMPDGQLIDCLHKIHQERNEQISNDGRPRESWTDLDLNAAAKPELFR